ncbi:MAG TPA: hypothetical protein DCM05_11445 [Elusimicrobia bacterium]|nr:hypothetical protein [Elusimicrobiota bacterium]
MKVRAAAWAGQFYPEEPEALAERVDALLAEAPELRFEGKVVAALSPHAGYDYSGRAAAKVYRALKGGLFDLAVVIGTHYPDREGLFLAPYDAYRTPLGEIPVAAEAAKALKAVPGASFSAEAHADHSVEVQLPFLQRALGELELLPLVANLRTAQEARRFGEALAEAVQGRRAVFIASSDLSHFPDARTSRGVDPASMDAFLTLDPEYLFLADRLILEHDAPNLRCAWCGLGSAAMALCAARRLGADGARLLDCTNSHEAGGEEERTVGYGAALLLKGGGGPPPWPVLDLTAEEGRELVALAQGSLEEFLRTGRSPGRRLYDRPRFNLPAAVFVTWEEADWKQGGLRGCIGTVEARETLGDATARCAILSAQDDPRFPPVTLEDLPRLKAEVSVLSPLRRIRPSDVRPGLGIQVRRGSREGLFLPQVWEKLPEVEEFMSVLCRQKAGLPAGAWREPGTELKGFSTRCYR